MFIEYYMHTNIPSVVIHSLSSHDHIDVIYDDDDGDDDDVDHHQSDDDGDDDDDAILTLFLMTIIDAYPPEGEKRIVKRFGIMIVYGTTKQNIFGLPMDNSPQVTVHWNRGNS